MGKSYRIDIAAFCDILLQSNIKPIKTTASNKWS